jgi:hypothetical protein
MAVVEFQMSDKQNLFELRDLLQRIDGCVSLDQFDWKIIYYEYNNVLKNESISDKIINYIVSERTDGLHLSFNELEGFSQSFLQTIDCRVIAKSTDNEFEILGIDSTTWEISSSNSDLINCIRLSCSDWT